VVIQRSGEDVVIEAKEAGETGVEYYVEHGDLDWTIL
jgi:hypothetical protein